MEKIELYLFVMMCTQVIGTCIGLLTALMSILLGLKTAKLSDKVNNSLDENYEGDEWKRS